MADDLLDYDEAGLLPDESEDEEDEEIEEDPAFEAVDETVTQNEGHASPAEVQPVQQEPQNMRAQRTSPVHIQRIPVPPRRPAVSSYQEPVGSSKAVREQYEKRWLSSNSNPSSQGHAVTGGDRGRGQVNRDRPVRGRDSGSGFSGRGRDAGRAFGRGRTGEPHQNGRDVPRRPSASQQGAINIPGGLELPNDFPPDMPLPFVLAPSSTGNRPLPMPPGLPLPFKASPRPVAVLPSVPVPPVRDIIGPREHFRPQEPQLRPQPIGRGSAPLGILSGSEFQPPPPPRTMDHWRGPQRGEMFPPEPVPGGGAGGPRMMPPFFGGSGVGRSSSGFSAGFSGGPVRSESAMQEPFFGRGPRIEQQPHWIRPSQEPELAGGSLLDDDMVSYPVVSGAQQQQRMGSAQRVRPGYTGGWQGGSLGPQQGGGEANFRVQAERRRAEEERLARERKETEEARILHAAELQKARLAEEKRAEEKRAEDDRKHKSLLQQLEQAKREKFALEQQAQRDAREELLRKAQLEEKARAEARKAQAELAARKEAEVENMRRLIAQKEAEIAKQKADLELAKQADAARRLTAQAAQPESRKPSPSPTPEAALVAVAAAEPSPDAAEPSPAAPEPPRSAPRSQRKSARGRSSEEPPPAAAERRSKRSRGASTAEAEDVTMTEAVAPPSRPARKSRAKPAEQPAGATRRRTRAEK